MMRTTLMFVLFLTFSSSYARVIQLYDSIDNYELFNDEFDIFEDTKGNVTLQEILNQPQQYTFLKYDAKDCYSMHPASNYWIRFNIQNKGDNNKWVLEMLDSRFNEVNFYTPELNNETHYLKNTTGLLHSFKDRPYNHKNFVFDISYTYQKDPQTYYVQIKPGTIGSFLMKVRKNKAFSSYSINEYLLLGMYYGVLLIMAFYNLFIYFSLKEKLHLFYFLYVMVWAFNSTLDDGLGYQYLWSDYPALSRSGYYISQSLLVVTYILYSQSFLNLWFYKNDKKNSLKLMLLLLLSGGVLMYLDLTLIYNCVFVFTFGYTSYQSFIIYRKGYKPAKLFLIGHAIIVGGLIIYMLKISGIFESYGEHPLVLIFMVYIKNVVMVIDIVILSRASADRMLFLRQTAEISQKEAYNQLNEKKILSEKVNRELEVKVSERTQELEAQKILVEQANEKLKDQAIEINKINALLDKDNWDLKKNIIQEKEARLIDKDINFEEFQQVYPDDLSCYRFIEELKDEDGYTCKKCGHKKYVKGLTTFSRRCVNCRYDESVTAYTIFHACKFNIQIAMYIVVMVNRYGKNISVSEISREVKLRNGTCAKFAQKLFFISDKKEYLRKNEKERIKMLIIHNGL